MIHPCCICGYRVPLSLDYPFDSRFKELSLCKDCKAYLEAYEKGGELSAVAEKYLKMMLDSNKLMDHRVRGYLNKLIGVCDEAPREEKWSERQQIERL